MKQILNALFLTIISLVTFSCSDVPSPYDINEGEGPAGIEGAGTYENPYTVADAIKTQNGNAAWVKGYIVGIMGNKYKPNGDFDGNEAVFTPPFTINTNVLIAATPDETNVKKCLPVKVKNGSDLANAINLVSHPDNLGQPLIIKGKLAAGFGMPSLIETTGAFFDGKLIGEGGGTDPEPPTGTVLFEETFAASQGLFTIENVQLPEGSTFVWQWSAYEGSGYMKASAFINDQNKAADSRLISPSIDLTTSTNATLVFDHAWKFAADKTTAFTLWVTEAGMNAWTQVAIPNYSDGTSWTFVSSGNISLNNYVGKNIQIAFKYVSTTESAGMWEVKNVKVVGDGEDVPEPPIDGTKIFTETFGPTVTATTKIADYTAWDNPDLTFSGIASDLRAIAHKTEANKTETTKVNNIWFPANKDSEFSISGIKAAGYSKFVLLYEAAANIYDAGATIDLNVLKVAFNGTELTVPSKVVTAEVKGADANIFYEMKVEINVAGIDNSTLKFSTASAQNNMGLRLYNIRLVGVEGGGTDPEPTAGELFISEYVEGSASNKYLEIYNPTGQAVDLSSYMLKLELNGGGAWTKEITLEGSLASHAVLVYKNSSAALYTGEAIVNNDVINFNGNDPIGLFKDGELIDLFGVSGAGSADFSKDETFRRKSTVKAPSATYNAAEWEPQGKDEVGGLGAHTMD